MRVKKFLMGVAVGVMGFGSAAAQYPERPVTVVVPYPPGGGVDILIRAAAAELSKKWGQPVVVDNKGGAGTLIGADAVSRAEPDGYTLLATLDQTVVANRVIYKKLPYDPDTSFTPITMLAESPHYLVAKEALPADDLKDFVALAKKEKGTLNYGSYGEGSWPQFVYATLNENYGLDVLHVPYKGVAQMMTALVGGQVDVGTGSASVVGEMVRAGRIKPLAIASSDRSEYFPDVPTTKELGFPEIQASVWYGLFAPAGTPDEVIQKLYTDVTQVLQKPTFVETHFKARGLSVVASNPEEFSNRIKEDVRSTTEMAKAAKIEAQ